MQEALGIPLGALTPTLPLVGLIGVYISLDQLAGKEKEVVEEEKRLWKQALEERREVTEEAARGWRSVGDPSTDVTLSTVVKRLWKRIGEIASKERRLRRIAFLYRQCRRLARIAVGVGVIICLTGFVWPSQRAAFVIVAVAVLGITVIVALIAKELESRIDAFGTEAMFRDGN